MRRRALLLILTHAVIAIVSFFVGAMVVSRVESEMRFLENEVAGTLVVHLEVLAASKLGDRAASEHLLEIMVDTATVSLARPLPDRPRLPNTRKALQLAKAFRAKDHPAQTRPEVDKALEGISVDPELLKTCSPHLAEYLGMPRTRPTGSQRQNSPAPGP